MSTRYAPSRAAAMMPFSPKYTSSTSDGYPTMVMTTSAAAAAAPGVSAHVAPRASSGSALARVRLCTTSE
jgi:hypothetical protein